MFQPLDVVFDEDTTGLVCFNITIKDDDIYEDSEVFQTLNYDACRSGCDCHPTFT